MPTEALLQPEMHEHDLMNISLTMDDAPWLEKLREEPIDDKWLEEANELIIKGSIDLRANNDPLVSTQVTDDRRTFFGQYLNWNNPKHPLAQAYRDLRDHSASLILMTTFIQTQRVIHSHGLDPAKIMRKFLPVIYSNPETIQEKIHTLEALGLDTKKIIHKIPHALGLTPQAVRERVRNLEELGIDAVKVINGQPSIFGNAPESVREKVHNLEELGIDAVKVINGMPATLTYAMESVREKMHNLQALGLNATKVINKMPTILGYAVTSIQQRMTYIERIKNVMDWAGETTELVNQFPALLGYSRKKLFAHARLFAEHLPPDAVLKESNIPAFVMDSLEVHVISLYKGAPYLQKNLGQVRRSIKGQDRKAIAGELLEDKLALEEKIGKKSVAAYIRYRDK